MLADLYQHPSAPVFFDPPKHAPEVAAAISATQRERTAAGFCPLCLKTLDDTGACPDRLCLCNWWGKQRPGVGSDPRR